MTQRLSAEDLLALYDMWSRLGGLALRSTDEGYSDFIDLMNRIHASAKYEAEREAGEPDQDGPWTEIGDDADLPKGSVVKQVLHMVTGSDAEPVLRRYVKGLPFSVFYLLTSESAPTTAHIWAKDKDDALIRAMDLSPIILTVLPGHVGLPTPSKGN